MTSKEIGSAMKSVGEVMAIGRSFEESMQKALRMTHPAMVGFSSQLPGEAVLLDTEEELNAALKVPSNTRIHAIAKALERGYSVDRICDLTMIDPWFLHKLKNIHNIQLEMKGNRNM